MHHLIELPLALLAGVLTIASPCVLPILPIVLGSTLGRTNGSRPLFIVAGFVLTFAALGMLLASASQHVTIAHETLRLAGLAMLMLTGLLMLWRAPYAWLMARVGGIAGAGAAAADNGGKLGGFSAPGGAETKRKLLALERARFAGRPDQASFAF